MARGWDKGGALVDMSTGRLICGDVGEGGGVGGAGLCLDGAGGFGFKPNVLAGHAPYDDSPPLIIGLGLSDISMELWMCWKVYSVDGTLYWSDMTGIFEPSGAFGNAMFHRIVSDWGPATPWQIEADHGADPPPDFGTAMTDVPGGWSHIVTNVDRNANLTVYVNGQETVSVAIGGDAADLYLDTGRFYAKTVGTRNPVPFNGVYEDLTTYHHSRYMVGPIALHTRLMTMAEIDNSFRGKRVQNFRTPDTIVHWDWRNIERLDGEPICWDFAETNTHHANLIGLEGRGIGLPTGTLGDVRVPDLSGEGNHWVLPTLASYARTATFLELSSTAFLVDPFFTS